MAEPPSSRIIEDSRLITERATSLNTTSVTKNAQRNDLRLGRKVTFWSIFASGLLAAVNVGIGLRAGSTSVVAVGLEFAGDVMASVVVLIGMTIAAKPADEDHPYGHGRYETLAGMIVGFILVAGGLGICWRSLQQVSELHQVPEIYAIWPLCFAMIVRGTMFTVKFRIGRRIHSSSLIADSWNDAVDILSAGAALVALGLTFYRPAQFLTADHYGGFVVGIVVVFTGLRIIWNTSLELTDVAPNEESLQHIRNIALGVPGVVGVEKCLARKSGLRYYVDLHVEVDPNLLVWQAHEIAGMTRTQLRTELRWVADVLVHIEPAPGIEPHNMSDKSSKGFS